MESTRPNPLAELSPILAATLLDKVPLAWLPSSEIPEPYHQLLVHNHDMTSELASFHRDSITLTVLQAKHSGDEYLREVVLHTSTADTPVEYGLIEIHLDSFPAELRPRILAGNTPLGTILNTSALPYRSQPQGFFTIAGESLKPVFLQTQTGEILYGRYNHLLLGESTLLARILEILPKSPT